MSRANNDRTSSVANNTVGDEKGQVPALATAVKTHYNAAHPRTKTRAALLAAVKSGNLQQVNHILFMYYDDLELPTYSDILLETNNPIIYDILVRKGAAIPEGNTTPDQLKAHLAQSVRMRYFRQAESILDRHRLDLSDNPELARITTNPAVLQKLFNAGAPPGTDTAEGRKAVVDFLLSAIGRNYATPQLLRIWFRHGIDPFTVIRPANPAIDLAARHLFTLDMEKHLKISPESYQTLFDEIDLSVENDVLMYMTAVYSQSPSQGILSLIEKAIRNGATFPDSIYPAGAPYVENLQHGFLRLVRLYPAKQKVMNLVLDAGLDPKHPFAMRELMEAMPKNIRVNWAALLHRMATAHPVYRQQMNTPIGIMTPIHRCMELMVAYPTHAFLRDTLEAALVCGGFVQQQRFNSPHHTLIANNTINRLLSQSNNNRTTIYRKQKANYKARLEQENYAERHRQMSRYFITGMAKPVLLAEAGGSIFGPPSCSAWLLKTSHPTQYAMIRSLLESFLPLGDEDSPGPLLFLHEHPIFYEGTELAGATMDFLEEYARQHLQDRNKNRVPCFMHPYCKKPLLPVEVSAAIQNEELLKFYLMPPMPKTGMNQNVHMYNTALTNVRSKDRHGFGHIYHSTMCPFCLRYEEREEGCTYMKHGGSQGPTPHCDPFFLVAELREKWIAAGRQAADHEATEAGFQALGAAMDSLEFCAECGRACWNHHHLELLPNAEGQYRYVSSATVSPEPYPAGQSAAGTCHGGGRVELFARMLAARDVYHSGAYMDPKEERRQAALAADAAPLRPEYMARAQALFDQEASERIWNVKVANTHPYNGPAYAMNASSSAANNDGNNGNVKENQGGGRRRLKKTRRVRRKVQKVQRRTQKKN